MISYLAIDRQLSEPFLIHNCISWPLPIRSFRAEIWLGAMRRMEGGYLKRAVSQDYSESY